MRNCVYGNVLIEADSFKPVFYARYVDDTFVLFRDESHYKLFLNYINSNHVNINFTVKTKSSNSLSFLDVNVSCSNNKFINPQYTENQLFPDKVSPY